MTWGDLSGALRTAQFLEQENERLVRPPRCVAKAHLAGSVRGDVGLGWMSIENGFDLASRRDDELRMQETSVPGRAAAGRADGHFDLFGQVRPDLLERRGQLQVRD
jgi:hypothetical protein